MPLTDPLKPALDALHRVRSHTPQPRPLNPSAMLTIWQARASRWHSPSGTCAHMPQRNPRAAACTASVIPASAASPATCIITTGHEQASATVHGSWRTCWPWPMHCVRDCLCDHRPRCLACCTTAKRRCRVAGGGIGISMVSRASSALRGAIGRRSRSASKARGSPTRRECRLGRPLARCKWLVTWRKQWLPPGHLRGALTTTFAVTWELEASMGSDPESLTTGAPCRRRGLGAPRTRQ